MKEYERNVFNQADKTRMVEKYYPRLIKRISKEVRVTIGPRRPSDPELVEV
jgi:hypothetical protein